MGSRARGRAAEALGVRGGFWWMAPRWVALGVSQGDARLMQGEVGGGWMPQITSEHHLSDLRCGEQAVSTFSCAGACGVCWGSLGLTSRQPM